MKKRWFANSALSVSFCLLCTACGFSPMYGNHAPANANGSAQEQTIQTQLSQIEIENIPDREGQFLRNALIDRFYKNGRPVNPIYKLVVSKITENTYNLDITINSDATRAQLTLSTTMKLVDPESNETVISRTLKASSSYNIMGSEFATRVSEQNTRENALNDLARQIELQIALHLNQVEQN